MQEFAIGKKVVGRWGAALPESYGKIVGTGKLGVRVRWDDLGETFYQYGELRNDYYDPQGSPVGVYVWVN
jgi:hypothetical protein